MTAWLKRFTLSLFSDKQAKESVKFGFGNILLTSFLAVVFIFLGIFAGGTAPFASYYDGAEEFREFLYNAFSADISVTVTDGRAEITSNGKEVNINTLLNDGDGIYAVNGYHLFVNSASVADTFDDFNAYCVDKNGVKIGYEEYLAFGDAERGNYRFSVDYTGKIKEITENDAEGYLTYLKGLNDKDINSKLETLEKEPLSEYHKNLYALYVQAYYPDVYNATGEAVPTLRTYYYRQTLGTDGRYLCLFGDMLIASFETYNGNKFAYGGTYKDGNNLLGGDAASVDGFIKNTFYDSVSMIFVIDLMGCISEIAITELIIVAAMLLGFAVCKLRKRGACSKFADSARIVSSYAHIAALISAVLTLCLSFAFSGIAVTLMAYVSFALILIVRTAVLLLREKEQPLEESEAQQL